MNTISRCFWESERRARTHRHTHRTVFSYDYQSEVAVGWWTCHMSTWPHYVTSNHQSIAPSPFRPQVIRKHKHATGFVVPLGTRYTSKHLDISSNNDSTFHWAADIHLPPSVVFLYLLSVPCGYFPKSFHTKVSSMISSSLHISWPKFMRTFLIAMHGTCPTHPIPLDLINLTTFLKSTSHEGPHNQMFPILLSPLRSNHSWNSPITMGHPAILVDVCLTASKCHLLKGHILYFLGTWLQHTLI